MPGGQNINISRIGDKDLKNIAINIDNNPSNGGRIKGSIDGGEVSLFWQQADPVIERKMNTPGFNLGYLQQFYDSHQIDKQIKSNSLDLGMAPSIGDFDVKPGREDREGEKLEVKKITAHDAPTRAEREAQRIAEIRRAAQARQVQTLSVSGGRSLQMASGVPVEIKFDMSNEGMIPEVKGDDGRRAERCIMGTITLPDAQGNKRIITLRISRESILTGGNGHEEATINRIIQQLRTTIDSLDPQIKNDLFSEVTDISIVKQDASQGELGTYSPYDNMLTLTYTEYIMTKDGKKPGVSGIDKKVLTHEIGHAVDEHRIELETNDFSTEELKEQFETVRNGLLDRYHMDAQNTRFTDDLYFLKDAKEFYAEWTAYKNGSSEDADYTRLRELEAAAQANPDDPTNKAFLTLVRSFESIEQNARASSLADRQGFSHVFKTNLSDDEKSKVRAFIESADSLSLTDLAPDSVGIGSFESYFEYAKSDNKEDNKFREFRLADSLLTKTDDEIRSEYGSNAERYIKLRDAWRDFKELANAKFEQLGWV